MTNLENIIEAVRNEIGYKYDLLTPVLLADVQDDMYYRQRVTNLTQVKQFNYQSDYWGSADEYQEQNVTAMKAIKPYINKVVEYAGRKVKIVAMLIDRQYNSIGHTDLLVQDIE